MSAKLDIFNDIVTKIESIVDTDNIRVINTVELWNSQLENEEEEVPFNFPAVFIEFGEVVWTTNQKPPSIGPQSDIVGEQKGINSLITIHIAFSQLDDETVSFPIISPKIDKVYFAIQRLSGEFYSELLRVAERQDIDHERVIDFQMDFLTTIFQCGEKDTSVIEIPGGTVDLDLTVDLDVDNDVIRTGDGTP